jgi:hypothetical protein
MIYIAEKKGVKVKVRGRMDGKESFGDSNSYPTVSHLIDNQLLIVGFVVHMLLKHSV